MLPEITQQNVHIFIPLKAAYIAVAISQDTGKDLMESLMAFYHSHAYQLLERERTKLWYESGPQIYLNYVKNELTA